MTKKYTKITRQIGVSFVFMSLTILCSPILIFLLTRSLTLTEFGVYSILSATIALSSSILSLGLPSYIIRALSGKERAEKIDSFFSILSFGLLFVSMFIIFIILTPADDIILGFLKMADYSTEFRISLLIILIWVISYLYSSYFTTNQRLEFVSMSNFFNKYLLLFFLLILFFVTGELTLFYVMVLWAFGGG